MQYIISVSDENDAKLRRRFPIPEDLFNKDVQDAVDAVDREDAEKAVQEQLETTQAAKPAADEDRTIVGQPETPIPVEQIIEPDRTESEPEVMNVDVPTSP